jgi:hypothetical protein
VTSGGEEVEKKDTEANPKTNSESGLTGGTSARSERMFEVGKERISDVGKKIEKPASQGAAASASLPAVDAPHFSEPGVVIADRIRVQVAKLATSFHEKTGRRLHVISGQRTPSSQARALYTKFSMGDDGSVYADQAAVSEIRKAYIANIANGEAATVKAMEDVITAQLGRGNSISRHLGGKAIDVRSWTLDSKQIEVLRSLVEGAGGKFLVEDKPPHIHIEFP